jgi:hypothetical protein
VNDQKDAEETSVDCGGGCGCRATYEVVLITGVPEGAGFGTLSAMSGDGSAFAGNIGRDDGGRFTPSYPARVDASGVVTELYGFGVSGNAFGINADGSVVVGDLYCDNPPDCTTAELYRPFRWTNDESPEVVFHNGSGMVVSASGAVVAGTQYDPQSGTNLAFRSSVNHWLDIPELNHVVGMSADGEYIAGRSSIDDAGAVYRRHQRRRGALRWVRLCRQYGGQARIRLARWHVLRVSETAWCRLQSIRRGQRRRRGCRGSERNELRATRVHLGQREWHPHGVG